MTGRQARGDPAVRRTVGGSGGLALAVFEQGSEPGPVVLAVHGYPDDHHVWDPVVERLRPDHHVVTYDVRGSGASGVPDGRSGYRMDALVSDLMAVADAVSPDRPVHLVGHDWGSIQGWAAVTDPRAAPRFTSYTSMSGPSLDHVAAWVRVRLLPGDGRWSARRCRPVAGGDGRPVRHPKPARRYRGDRAQSRAPVGGWPPLAAPVASRRDCPLGGLPRRCHRSGWQARSATMSDHAGSTESRASPMSGVCRLAYFCRPPPCELIRGASLGAVQMSSRVTFAWPTKSRTVRTIDLSSALARIFATRCPLACGYVGGGPPNGCSGISRNSPGPLLCGCTDYPLYAIFIR